MADNKCSCLGSLTGRETVCIDTHRVLDSCKDRDCYEDQRVWLTEFGQDIIDHTSVVRVRKAEIVRACVNVEPVDFSRGFYRVYVRYYIKLTFEACVCRGNSQEFDGIVVLDKSVVLYGGEGHVHVFRSNGRDFCDSCDKCDEQQGTNAPNAVVETASPVVLNVKVAQVGCRCVCACDCNEIPDSVCSYVSGAICPARDRRVLLVSIGIFSVIRIERPTQLLVNAACCAVPEKECCACDNGNCDPCTVFKDMDFPVDEFCPTAQCGIEKHCK
ncbi:MAG: hypothetical protein IKB35_01065 [Clostridia bacterium]|nr:hypothetical protein [Clostridia bacterium]